MKQIIEIAVFFPTDAPIDARTDAQKSISAAVGSTVSLVCAVDANPVASYEWYRSNQLVSNQREYTFALSSLALLGSYTCKATNSRGSVELRYTLSEGILTINHFSHQCFSLFIILTARLCFGALLYVNDFTFYHRKSMLRYMYL